MEEGEGSSDEVVVVSEAGGEPSEFTVQVRFVNGHVREEVTTTVKNTEEREGEGRREEEGRGEEGEGEGEEEEESTIFREEDPDSVSGVE